MATLTVVQLGSYTRFMRGAMIEALRQDYVRTARAKGASESRVLWGHAFANALAPVLTILALSFGGLFSGALITETMFAWPGMGKAIYQAILDNDYNLALVGLLVATLRHHHRQPAGRPRLCLGRSARLDRRDRMSDAASAGPAGPGVA